MKKFILPILIASQFAFAEPNAIAASTTVTLRVLPAKHLSLITSKLKAMPSNVATIKKINGPTMLIFSQY